MLRKTHLKAPQERGPPRFYPIGTWTPSHLQNPRPLCDFTMFSFRATQAARSLGRLPRWGWETLRGPGAFLERRGALDSRPPGAGAQVSSQAGFAAQSPAPPPPRRPRCAPPLSAPGPGGGRWLDPNTRGLWREVGRRRGSPGTARPCPLQHAARRRGAASSPQALGAAAARAAGGSPGRPFSPPPFLSFASPPSRPVSAALPPLPPPSPIGREGRSRRLFPASLQT